MKKKLKKKIKVLVILLIFIIIIKVGYDNLSKQISFFNKQNEIDTNFDNTNIYDMSKYQTYDDVSMLKYENGTIKSRLKLMAKQDERINNIIDNYNDYPEKLLEALSRNIELVTFVMNYQDKKNNVYSDNIGNINNKIPELYQFDERWGYGKYGNSIIAISGCGPTALAMVASGLKNDSTITPYKVAKLAEAKGYYVENVGTSWDLFTNGAKDYGLNIRELPLTKDIIYTSLKNGHPIICSMRKGDFTINGHYIVLTEIQDDKIKINDPNSKIRSSILWDFDRIKNQIKNLWEFY